MVQLQMCVTDKASLYHDQTQNKENKKIKEVNLIVINVLRLRF